jgi:hypothetical protein
MMMSRSAGVLSALSMWSALVVGCAAVRTHATPEGDMVLGRGDATLFVPTRGLTIVKSQVGGLLVDPYVLATDKSGAVAISATLEAAVDGDCREHYWGNLQKTEGIHTEDINRRSRGQFQVVEYTLRESLDPRFKGVEINQRNSIGCVTRGNVTAFVHVSKVQWTPQDEAGFAAMYDQVRLDAR